MSILPLYTKIDKSDTWSLGKGRPMVAIHGGPGLDCKYLIDYLVPLASHRKIIFYNQLGCGNGNNLPNDFTVSDLFSQLVGIVRQVGRSEPVDILAHSWGAYILYETMRSKPDINFDRVIFISPVGLNRKRFDASGERLIARVPEEVLKTIEKMETEGKGTEMMNILSPFYCADTQSDTRIVFNHYNPQTYYKVIESLDEYDCRDIGKYLPKNTNLIYGEKDIERPEDTREIHDRAALTIINGAGHFPFAEKPVDFINTVAPLLIK